MTTLETDRLLLRPWTRDDLDDFHAYARNPNVGPAAGWAPHADKEASSRILDDFIAKGEVWAIQEKATGRVVGSLGLHPDRKRSVEDARMMGYVLAEEAWGRGLCTEAARRVLRHAFEDLGLALVSICHFPWNLRSKRVIEKCGFRLEGTLRHASRIFDGTVQDDVCYSMTREEYTEVVRKT